MTSNYLSRMPNTLLAIDPSINTTGVCVMQHSDANTTPNHCYNCRDFRFELRYKPWARRILDHHIIKTGEIEDTAESARALVSHVLLYLKQFHITHLVIEQPPYTIYDQKFSSKDMLVARAQAVFKTFAAAYAIHGALADKLKTLMIFPRDWEPGKKQRGGLEAKEWSMQQANAALLYHGISSLGISRRPRLTTKEDQNIADAIMMAEVMCSKLEAGMVDYAY